MSYEFKKKGSSSWYVGFRNKHGKDEQRATKARTRAEARQMGVDLERLHRNIELGLVADPEKEPQKKEAPSFSEAMEGFLAALDPKYKSRDSLEGRLRNRIAPHMGTMKVDAVTRGDVEEIVFKRNADASRQTQKHLKNHISKVYNWLISKKLATENPTKGIVVKIPKRKPKALQANQVPSLLENVFPEYWRAPILFSLATGGRKWEVLGLLKSDIDLPRRLVHFRRAFHDTTKSEKERSVPIPEWLVPYIEAQLQRTPGRLVFPNKLGKRWNKTIKTHEIVKRALLRAGLVTGYEQVCFACGAYEETENKTPVACEVCGGPTEAFGIPLPIRFKELRSTWATHAVKATGDMRFAQTILGHEDAKTTEFYVADLPQEHLRRLANLIEYELPAASSRLQENIEKQEQIEVTQSKQETGKGK